MGGGLVVGEMGMEMEREREKEGERVVYKDVFWVE